MPTPFTDQPNCLPFEFDSEIEEAAEPKTLFTVFPPHQRLCYYPSCGPHLLWAVMQLDADLFVFSDKEYRYSSWPSIKNDFKRHGHQLELIELEPGFVQFRSQGKIAMLFWEDNNIVVERLRQTGLQVHHFVGICDGCCEGGNYECVHERPFMRRLMRVAAWEMRYSTDHSRPLQDFDIHTGRGMFHTRKFLDRVRLDQYPTSKGWWPPSMYPEPDASDVPEALFELQGVLVRPNGYRDIDHYEILPKGDMGPTQLDALRPFRTLRGRGRLAEFRVRLRLRGAERRRAMELGIDPDWPDFFDMPGRPVR